MFDEPDDLRPHHIARLLDERWGLRATRVMYAPVGFGSYHWVATGPDGEPAWFVTADRLIDPDTHDVLARIARATSELARQGMEFVLTGLADRTGRPLVGHDGWAIQVFPYLAGTTADFGTWNEPAERRQIAEVLGRLHRADPPESLPQWRSAIPHRDTLNEAFANTGQRWTGGAYGERARAVLLEGRKAIEQQLARYDALAAAVEAASADWVVSHGEPHAGNVLRTGGRMVLIDWDTLRLAPRERDLVNAFGDLDSDILEVYQATAGPVTVNAEAVELFVLWWRLAEICGCTRRFRGTHGDGEDDKVSWRAFMHYLPNA